MQDVSVDTREADGVQALAAQGRQDVEVDAAGEHHLRDVERLLVGHAAPLHHAWLEPESPTQVETVRQGHLPQVAVRFLARQIFQVEVSISRRQTMIRCIPKTLQLE